MDYKTSLDEVLKIIDELIDENKDIPILVEGGKDKKALKKLNIKGKIITINSGKNLIDFCDKLAKKYNEIIILTDWDRKGGFLRKRIQQNLKGRTKCITKYRRLLSKNTMIKTVEGLPSYIKTMTKQ